MVMPPTPGLAVAEAVLAFHGVRRQLESDSEEGMPAWLTGLLMICGLCCCLAALGKYRFDADGAQPSNVSLAADCMR
jgi:hypothetical protein